MVKVFHLDVEKANCISNDLRDVRYFISPSVKANVEDNCNACSAVIFRVFTSLISASEFMAFDVASFFTSSNVNTFEVAKTAFSSALNSPYNAFLLRILASSCFEAMTPFNVSAVPIPKSLLFAAIAIRCAPHRIVAAPSAEDNSLQCDTSSVMSLIVPFIIPLLEFAMS